MNKLVWLSSLIFLTACGQNKEAKLLTETLEIYQAKADEEGYIRGDMTHYESKNYKAGKHLETYFYDANGEVRGYEVITYDDNKPAGSNYFNADGDRLSYYTYEYDARGRKSKVHGYESGTDELLRIEYFGYEDDRRIYKEIRNSNDLLQQKFLFEHDGYGNEIAMYVTNPSGDTIATETYQITEYHPDNTWKEKWGFSNDIPTTYQIKK